MKTKIIIAGLTLLLGVTVNAQETTTITPEQVKLVRQKDSLTAIQANLDRIQAEKAKETAEKERVTAEKERKRAEEESNRAEKEKYGRKCNVTETHYHRLLHASCNLQSVCGSHRTARWTRSGAPRS